MLTSECGIAKLIYSILASLDGFVADEDGKFDWAEPDEEVHSFINELERRVGTYLYGRRLYDVMRVWETLSLEEEPAVIRDYAESGARPTRSCSPERCATSRRQGPGSSATSTPRP